MICTECYSSKKRITPLLEPFDCLKNHQQYICGSCGRVICYGKTKDGLQRWNFPFKTKEIALLYLRTADYSCQKPCGIYQIENQKGRISYKIFSSLAEAQIYQRKNPTKKVSSEAVFKQALFKDYPNTEVRYLTDEEIERYLEERSQDND